MTVAVRDDETAKSNVYVIPLDQDQAPKYAAPKASRDARNNEKNTNLR